MDSDDYPTDEGTKKRSFDDEGSIFSKSKKILRSPKRYQDDKLEQVLKMLQGIMNEMREMREEQKQYREEIGELRKENEQIRHENVMLKHKIEKIETTIDRMEKEKRRNNVVIQGLNTKLQNEKTVKEVVEEFIKKNLQPEINIKSAKKLSDQVCLVEFNNRMDKEKIMKVKNKLKHLKSPRVFINDDMSREEREIQGKIRKKAKEEKADGKSVKIGFQKIIINGEEWVWNKNEENFMKTRKAKN